MHSLEISEETFDLFYKVASTNLKKIKCNIRVVSASLKKINTLRDHIIYDASYECPVPAPPVVKQSSGKAM